MGNRFSPPVDEFNLFAQNSNFNRGVYRTMENEWATALAEGKNVNVRWSFEYSGSSLRPSGMTVTYSIDGVVYPPRRYGNNPGGRP